MTSTERAITAWTEWCAALERAGRRALERNMTTDEIDLAEGLRHLARLSAMSIDSAFENGDAQHPYLALSLGPTRKMGGDNPLGLYVSAPINSADTFILRGTRGSAVWTSMMAQRRPDALAHGLTVFGDAVFAPDLLVDADGRFEVIISPTEQRGNWIKTDDFSNRLIIRQFFADEVVPMELSIENTTGGEGAPAPLRVEHAAASLHRAAGAFERFSSMFQDELIGKGGERLNTFATDIGDPTSTSGGVPGGNAVTCRWHLEPNEALLIEVRPPAGCPYWDVQVGNVWYESFDYRHYISGFNLDQATINADGSVTIVLADRDPGTANWVQAAAHHEGHLAIRWQLTDGVLPIPTTRVVAVDEVAALTGLPRIDATGRREQHRRRKLGVERRFAPSR